MTPDDLREMVRREREKSDGRPLALHESTVLVPPWYPARMANVTCSRLISSAASATMTTTFLAAIRAANVTRNASGFIVDAAGTVRACYVNTAGNWDLTTTLASGVPIDAVTFADLRQSPAGYSRAFVMMTLANGTKAGICVAVDPPDPVDPG